MALFHVCLLQLEVLKLDSYRVRTGMSKLPPKSDAMFFIKWESPEKLRRHICNASRLIISSTGIHMITARKKEISVPEIMNHGTRDGFMRYELLKLQNQPLFFGRGQW